MLLSSSVFVLLLATLLVVLISQWTSTSTTRIEAFQIRSDHLSSTKIFGSSLSYYNSKQQQQQQQHSSLSPFIKNDIISRKNYHYQQQQQHQRCSLFVLKASVVMPDDNDNNVVGIVGRGYVPTLCAKLCALDGYQTWMITPTSEKERIESLVYSDNQLEMNDIIKNNLSLVDASDTETLQEWSSKTNAYIMSVDTDSVLTNDVIDFLISSSDNNNLKRIVGMSRNLNKKGMGFFVKASKLSANNEVWYPDDSLVNEYKEFENKLKSLDGIDYTIVRAGTLKGGGCGDETYSLETDEEGTGNSYYPRYLSSKFYEYTKKDIVTWQLLFDCNIRGITIEKGDVMEGPGIKAAFTATSNDECIGDTSRCSIAEAMVRSLQHTNTCNIDFAIGTKSQRNPLTNDEWNTIFQQL